MTHPSFGILTPEEFKLCVSAPFGGAGAIIRRRDPAWGKTSGDACALKTFKVKVTAERTVTETLERSYTVQSTDAEGAEALAEEQAKADHFDWGCGIYQDVEKSFYANTAMVIE